MTLNYDIVQNLGEHIGSNGEHIGSKGEHIDSKGEHIGSKGEHIGSPLLIEQSFTLPFQVASSFLLELCASSLIAPPL